MCFSATASFVAGGAVAVAGAAVLRQAKTFPQAILAAVPIFFAVQQFSEGALWLSLSGGRHTAWQHPAMLTFLIVAKVVWPVWVPMVILAAEKNPKRRTVLSALLAIGAIAAVSFAYWLSVYPVSAGVSGHHIRYRIDSPLAFRRVADISYLIATVLPPFLSSMNLLRLLGLMIFASFLVSKVYFHDSVISVWCFFAALISALIVFIVKAGHPHSAAVRP